MADYEVVVPRDVHKQIRSISLPWRARIERAIDSLASDPFLGGKMKGEFKEKRRIRVWPYRIFYYIHKQDKVILIVEVQHRGGTRYK
jgi:mRNA-degrading endonuclease RelE of RelBE toxin-antitoxin system